MEHYRAEKAIFKDFDGMKNLEKKIIYLHGLQWDWQEGKYMTDYMAYREIKIYDAKHLKNWLKKYDGDKIIENLDEVLHYFKN